MFEQNQSRLTELLSHDKTFQSCYEIGSLYQKHMNLPKAIEYYLKAIKLNPGIPEIHFSLASSYAIIGSLDQSINHYQRAIELKPDFLKAYFELINVLTRLNKEDLIIKLFNHIRALFPDLKQSPSVFFNTLPRSASIYISSTIRMLLQREFIMVGPLDTLNESIIPVNMKMFSNGGLFTHGHFPATEWNLRLLNSFCKKLVIHLRDPRQSVLSLIYFFKKHGKNHNETLKLDPPLPDNYFEWPLTKQIDWNLNYYYPKLLQWISQWKKVKDQNLFKGDIMFTHFEDFANHSEDFLSKFLNFYNLSAHVTTHVALTPLKGHHHFRKGDLSEWKTVFSNEQLEYVNDLLPLELRNAFNWRY